MRTEAGAADNYGVPDHLPTRMLRRQIRSLSSRPFVSAAAWQVDKRGTACKVENTLLLLVEIRSDLQV